MNIRNKLKIVKLSDIIPYEKNAKKHTPGQIDALKKSIQDNDYIQPIGIDEKNIIVMGHARTAALNAIDPGMDVEVVDLSYLDKKQIKKLRILDNKVSSIDYDPDLLLTEIEDIYGNLDNPVEIGSDLFLSDEDMRCTADPIVGTTARLPMNSGTGGQKQPHRYVRLVYGSPKSHGSNLNWGGPR